VRRVHPDENVVSFLRPFAALTSLTLIMRAWSNGRWTYEANTLLESCPLLVDLVIAMEVSFIRTLNSLQYPDRQAPLLKRLTLLCDPTPPKVEKGTEMIYTFPAQHIHDLVTLSKK
jgi:hypothetical protein